MNAIEHLCFILFAKSYSSLSTIPLHKPTKLLHKPQLKTPHRPIPMLRHMNLRHLFLLRFLIVIILAIHKHNDIRILLNLSCLSKSDKRGRLSCRDSTERDNCDNATTQTFNSRANNKLTRNLTNLLKSVALMLWITRNKLQVIYNN